MTAPITLTPISPADAHLLDNLWQFYELESSAWSQEEIDSEGRFNSLSAFLDRLRDPYAVAEGYFIRHGVRVVGFVLVGLQQLHGQAIKELADLYVLPKYRGLGIASQVIHQTIMASDSPWLIGVFRADVHAQRFWERAFQRLPFSSVRELLPPEYPDLREFVVNEGPAKADC
ncbi:GNAT family N-acetyltransferase [Roseateles amylovorans]|uniref:GNAT family N-acetyltransferase n=1 Tax=Roseateles amylovorans TaxID=2978473 RepID=A0ABY6B5Y9_9BURK|nr:GNAT family N-acetyltransferase [Roseateles amylovorans]UXH80669.1 GNAT family N-acetyltransferase [Roseateles amylovorans]